MSTWLTPVAIAAAVAGIIAGAAAAACTQAEPLFTGAPPQRLAMGEAGDGDGDLGPPAAHVGVTTAAAAAPEALEAAPHAEGEGADDDAGPDEAVAAGPTLATPLDVWPIALTEGRLDAVAARAEVLYLATHEAPARPLLDPAVVRVRALGTDGGEAGAPWEVRILGPSPLALATSGDRVVAAWSQRAHPGRELVVMEVPEAPAGGLHETLRPPGDAPFTPQGRPLLAASGDDGWLLCSAAASGPGRCVHLGADGERSWQTLTGLRSYPLWRLVATSTGYLLFATDCPPDSCGTFRVVLQELDGRGQPRGALRVIANLVSSRRFGVVPVGDAALVYGRRARAKLSTALLVARRGTKELEGRWDRMAGGVPVEGGAVLLEADRLRMVDGLPVAGNRPRRFTRPDQRAESEAWPAAAAALLPTALEQRLLVDHDVIAVVAPSRATGVGLHGAALRLRPDRAVDEPSPPEAALAGASPAGP